MTQFCSQLPVLLFHGLRQLPVDLQERFLLFLRLVLAGLQIPQTDRGTGLIDDVDRLVRQIPVINVADGQIHRRLQCFLLHLHTVMLFIF